ncbi:unnamed protein product [Durusdinium trenchii]|uniref:Uncharacterized protein n=1 Tax=Durusdinium trenchii TaxID=1381693 RepID=A0ABP0LPG1_9DINO
MSMPCAEKGSVQIFELIAQFLEQCHFTTAAHAIIAQCSEHVPPLEGVLQRFRSHVDNCALLLAELEAIKPKSETGREAVVHDLLDNLLRKLMATGQCLSDDKLLTCIDTTLKSDAFPKLDVMERQVAGENPDSPEPSGYGYGESAKLAASRFKKHKGTSISGRAPAARLSPAVSQTVDVDGLDIASPEMRLHPSQESVQSKELTPEHEIAVDTTVNNALVAPGRRSNRKRPKMKMVPAIEAEVVEEEPEQVPEAPEACLLRDADVLEAWSRGEFATQLVKDLDETGWLRTLIIDDEFQIEQGAVMDNGHVEGDLSLGTKARRLRRRVKRRVRRIQEDLLASEIDADIDAESFMEEAIAQGQSWWSEGMEVWRGMQVGDADFEGLEDLDLEETQEIEDSEELEELEEFGNEEVEPVELLEEGEEELECEADPLALLDPLDQLDQSTDQEAEELEGVEERPATASLVPAARISKEEPRKRARLVPEKSQTLAVARLRSRPQLKPAIVESKAGEKRKSLAGSTDLTDPMQARYMPPHEKRRRIELAKWKEIKAAWHRKLLEEEAQGPRKQKQKAEPNMRALARRFEATLEKPGSCCFNPLQKDERIVISADGLRAQCEATTPNVTTSSGIKGLPLVAGGKYQYEVELRRGCDLTIGWSPALVLPSALASSGRSAARRMLGYSSDGELIGEGCLIGVPPFGRQGDVVSALLDWQAGSCGPRLSFMLNGRNLGMAFDLRAEGIEIPPLQPHVCQGQGRPFSILLRGATPQVPLRFPMPGYRPLGNIAEEHFSPFSKAVELATSSAENGALRQQKPPPAAARRLIHSSLGLALPLPHVAQDATHRNTWDAFSSHSLNS